MSKEKNKLQKAIRQPNAKALKELLSNDSSINLNTKYGVTAIYQLLDYIYEPVVEKVKLFIDRGFDINQKRNDKAYSLLHMAVSYGSPELVAMIIKNGADINEKRNKYMRTPLHFSKNANIAALLLQNGAALNIKDKEGNTPLNVFLHGPSKSYPESEIYKQSKLMLDAGANVDTVNENGTTPLINALSFPLKKCVHLLLEYNPDVNCQDSGGNTPLHIAVNQELSGILQILIDQKADVNMVNPHNHWTALFFAAFNGNVKIVEILLKAGANKEVVDIHGKKPIDYVKNKEIEELLK